MSENENTGWGVSTREMMSSDAVTGWGHPEDARKVGTDVTSFMNYATSLYNFECC